MIKSRLIVMVVVALAASCSVLRAQDSPVSFNIRGGIDFSTYGGDLPDTKMALKQHVGVGADIALMGNMFLSTGIDFQTKGSKQKFGTGQKIKYNAMYLQMPVHAGYKLALSPKWSLSAEAGPYIAYGIGGKIKGENKVNTFGDGRLKKFDWGAGLAVGVEYYRNFLKVGYDYGFMNISDMSGIKIRNRNLFITSGYRF